MPFLPPIEQRRGSSAFAEEIKIRLVVSLAGISVVYGGDNTRTQQQDINRAKALTAELEN